MSGERTIEVVADWVALGGAMTMGWLTVSEARGKEVFAFEYDEDWLASEHVSDLDPDLSLFPGRQYPTAERANFGLFLDSSPDRWGRVLMERHEAQRARDEHRRPRRLFESDYLLGVHDTHRMGALRFRIDDRFVDDDPKVAAPPITSLGELEHASLQLERDDARSDPAYGRWLRMLIAPGGSLGGARPKAGVIDVQGDLWVAKFPSRGDDEDVGAWEFVVHELAVAAGLTVADAKLRRFGSDHQTFLSRRFDRAGEGKRLHMASAMTLLGHTDRGADASYLELAEVLMQRGAATNADLEELWRRIVFFICVSNTDDHLRNHAFMLGSGGWRLAPAYDMNPNRDGYGLKLNISDSDNAQRRELAREVAQFFRLSDAKAAAIEDQVVDAVRGWRRVAGEVGLSRESQERMAPAFRLVE